MGTGRKLTTRRRESMGIGRNHTEARPEDAAAIVKSTRRIQVPDKAEKAYMKKLKFNCYRNFIQRRKVFI
jgi:hypothetical protein